MLGKAYGKWRAEGIWALLQAGQRRIWLQRLQYLPQCAPMFDGRIGLEIGGPSAIFGRRGPIPVYPLAARIDNCNFNNSTVWGAGQEAGITFSFDGHREPGRQYIAEATDLCEIGDSEYDFVLSSHCIEHLANPLRGLGEWVRVLRVGGLLVLVVPHKDGTFDHRRPVTTLEHLMQDYRCQTTEADLTHLPEILACHDLGRDQGAGTLEEFRDRSMRNLENRCLHQHVFDTRLVVQVVDHVGLQILAVEPFLPCHIALIAKKAAADQAVDNTRFLSAKGATPWVSPFPSDRPPGRD